MPKLIPLLLHIEEIAFGTVLLKCHEMPGVAKYDIPLGAGGEGAGRKQLEQAAAAAASSNGHRPRAVVAMLASGPKHIQDIMRAVGGKPSRAYSVMNGLRKNGIAESIGGARWQLTKKARAHIADAPPAPTALLPPPTKTPSGRASNGRAPIVLRAMLASGPKTPGQLREEMIANGVKPNSVSGVMERAKRDGIMRKNGAGYELTAKGTKQAEAAHG
jgi:hypothetical protein